MGEDLEFGDDVEYEQCEMCGQEKIRYVHILQHSDFNGELRAGCVCAEHMTDDYINPQKSERELKNRLNRKKILCAENGGNARKENMCYGIRAKI